MHLREEKKTSFGREGLQNLNRKPFTLEKYN
jgi:hypothetical protein